MTSGSFNELVSSLSADEYPLTLLEIDHSSLGTPFRWVNDNTDITSNSDVYYASSFSLKIPNQPKDGQGYATLSVGNPGDKTLTDFLDTTLGVGVTATISVVLRSSPNDVEYQVTAPAIGFVVTKASISCKIAPKNYYRIQSFPILYGSKYSPSLL